MAIHDLEIVEVGPVDRNSDGTAMLDKKDFIDRMEF
jgi:hypothetical protein